MIRPLIATPCIRRRENDELMLDVIAAKARRDAADRIKISRQEAVVSFGGQG